MAELEVHVGYYKHPKKLSEKIMAVFNRFPSVQNIGNRILEKAELCAVAPLHHVDAAEATIKAKRPLLVLPAAGLGKGLGDVLWKKKKVEERQEQLQRLMYAIPPGGGDLERAIEEEQKKAMEERLQTERKAWEIFESRRDHELVIAACIEDLVARTRGRPVGVLIPYALKESINWERVKELVRKRLGKEVKIIHHEWKGSK